MYVSQLFLGVIKGSDASAWPAQLAKARDAYAYLLDKLITNPSLDAPELDLSVNNPLSTHSASPWSQYFQDSELSSEIKLDLERTYPENEFFHKPDIQKHMLHVLFVWAKLHPDYSYRQGMNEILAPIVLTVHRDAFPANAFNAAASASTAATAASGDSTNASGTAAAAPASSDTESLKEGDRAAVSAMFDDRFVEHDSFELFSRIMYVIAPYFATKPTAAPHRAPTTAPDAGAAGKPGAKKHQAAGHKHHHHAKHGKGQRGGSMDDDDDLIPSEKGGAAPAAPTESPIVAKCNYIFSTLLTRVDAPLYGHLQSLDIQPQLFLLRWSRLLFAREFHLEDVMRIWDAVFCSALNRLPESLPHTSSATPALPPPPLAATAASPSRAAPWRGHEIEHRFQIEDVGFPLSDFLCLAMCLYIRGQLIQGDSSFCLRRLLKYPPVENMDILLETAQYLLARSYSGSIKHVTLKDLLPAPTPIPAQVAASVSPTVRSSSPALNAPVTAGSKKGTSDLTGMIADVFTGTGSSTSTQTLSADAPLARAAAPKASAASNTRLFAPGMQ